MLLCCFKNYPNKSSNLIKTNLSLSLFTSLNPEREIFHSVTSYSTYSELIVTYLKSILNSKKVKPKPNLKIIYSYYFKIYISTLLKKSLVLGFLGLPNISSGLPSSAIIPPSIKSTLSDTSLAKPIS